MSLRLDSFFALLSASMACWLERQAAAQIEYLKAENRALRSRLGRRRIRFTDAERRTLATLARKVGRKTLADLDPIVTPATLLRWHRELVARKWTFLERRRPGRPRTESDVEQLIVRMASENPGWGYTRIHGALSNLKIEVGRGTIRRILKDHLIEPAPTRGRRISWSTFLKAHWRALAASDFFTVEVWGCTGLVTMYVLFVIELSTRRVTICGITAHPNEAWMLQISRNLIDAESGALCGKTHLITDRDTKYSQAFRLALEREGIGVIRLPPRSPNLNAYAERFVKSVKEECLSKLIPIGPTIVPATFTPEAKAGGRCIDARHRHLPCSETMATVTCGNRSGVGAYTIAENTMTGSELPSQDMLIGVYIENGIFPYQYGTSVISKSKP